MNSNVISGGNVVVTNEFFPTGLAYCSSGEGATFFCTNSSGLAKYDSNLGWINVINNPEAINNGGFANHHYFIEEDALKYFNGVDTTTVAILGYGIGVADIAVDSQGNAWVFTGNDGFPIITSSLKVFSATGLIISYPISFNSTGTYGAMFLNDTLYILKNSGQFVTNENTLTPVVINGSIAELGTPIPFVCPNCQDAASCNINLLRVVENSFSEVLLSPNPADSILDIQAKSPIAEIAIYDLKGILIQIIQATDIKQVSVGELPPGIYLARIKDFSGAISQQKILVAH
ncbi:T9SS type A sorting domain-containing protein [Flavobacterium sp.]|uniref:T9SS type A sorting domain-containing protein n=1 Tax=Flavobacterium sp. TaxID=239 RepID=UPI002619E762|nr:T9SS type A sorting domain-containing protein [Flavobacterium sp.]